MTWRPAGDSDKAHIWIILGDLIPLHASMVRVPVQLEGAPGNPSWPTNATISKLAYQCAQYNGQRVFYDGEYAKAVKLEGDSLMIQAD